MKIRLARENIIDLECEICNEKCPLFKGWTSGSGSCETYVNYCKWDNQKQVTYAIDEHPLYEYPSEARKCPLEYTEEDAFVDEQDLHGMLDYLFYGKNKKNDDSQPTMEELLYTKQLININIQQRKDDCEPEKDILKRVEEMIEIERRKK